MDKNKNDNICMCLLDLVCWYIKPNTNASDTVEHPSPALPSQSLVSLCHGFIRKTVISDM